MTLLFQSAKTLVKILFMASRVGVIKFSTWKNLLKRRDSLGLQLDGTPPMQSVAMETAGLKV